MTAGPEWIEQFARRVRSNRLSGLLREIAEAIDDEDDSETLRQAERYLRLLSGRAHSRRFTQP